MNDFSIPPDAPLWFVILAAFAGWIAANVWPLIKNFLVEKAGLHIETVRARTNLEIELQKRQIDLQERRLEQDKVLANVLQELSMLVKENIGRMNDMQQTLLMMSSMLSSVPTLRDYEALHAKLNTIIDLLTQKK